MGIEKLALDFAGKRALVVGGSSGIGNGIAQALRAHGAEVEAWGTRARAADYAGEAGSNLDGLHYVQVNAADVDAVAAKARGAEKLDVLILAQGGPMHDGAEFDLANFQKVVALNLTSVMACAQSFYPALKAARGAVVTISSISAHHSNNTNPAYASAKAGAVRLTSVLASAWAKDGIRVNSVAPGLVLTKIAKSSGDPELAAHAKRIIPLGRIGEPVDMAAAALFLASPLASYVTGQTLAVDGGLGLV